jgi:hypothetical protein
MYVYIVVHPLIIMVRTRLNELIGWGSLHDAQNTTRHWHKIFDFIHTKELDGHG